MKPLISIISVNYNSLDTTCEMLESVRNNSYPNVEILVVDNASEESPKPYLNKHFPEVKVIESPTNRGFAGGNNLGIIQCAGEFILLLNNDAELTDGALEKLHTLFEQVSTLGAVSPKICFHMGRPDHTSEPAVFDLIQYAGTTPVHYLTGRNRTMGRMEPDKGQYSEARPTGNAHGAAMMVKREVIEKVGLMPEEFFLYYEELDWCEKIRRAGYDIYVEPNAKVYHKEANTVGKTSTLRTYCETRNRILFMRRNRDGWALAVFCLFLLFFTIPKNAFAFLFKADMPNLKAFFKGIFWNIKDRFRQNRSHHKNRTNTLSSEAKPQPA